jgi:hypothetical protein
MKRDPVRDIREVIREEPLVRGRLLRLLSTGPLTVPELAERAGLPENEVMVWVMGMRKYGYLVAQDQTDEGYFRYAAVKGP